MGASAKIIYYKSKTFSDGKHPVLLRVTIERKLKYYNIGNNYKCFDNQWKDGQFTKKFPEHDKANKQLFKALTKATDIIVDLKENVPYYNIQDFHKRYDTTKERIYLFPYFDQIIDRLNKAGKAGNAEVYKTSRSVFYKFFKEDDSIEMTDLTNKKLNLFIEKCTGKGLKPNSIGNYLRTLRALYNTAIKEEGYEYYPFKNFDWSKLKNTTSKRAISKEDMIKLVNHEFEKGTFQYDAQKLFTLMYLTYGLNFSDLAKMKEENIVPVHGNYLLEYNRSKGGKLYQIPLNSKAFEIINYYKSKDLENGYIFPVLHKEIHITEQQIKTRIKTALKKFNHDLKIVAKEVGIKEKITTYVSRHTFASVLAKEGQSIVTIGEMLGHSDINTTQIYLKELDHSEKIEASNKLLE